MYNPFDLFVLFLDSYVPDSKVRLLEVCPRSQKNVTYVLLMFIDKARKEV